MTTTAGVEFVSPFPGRAFGELDPDERKVWQRAYARWHYAQNRAKYREQQAESYRRNPEPKRAQERARSAAKDPEAERVRKRESYAKHRVEIGARRAERRRSTDVRAQRADEQAVARARRHGVLFERVRRLVVWARDEGWCYLCGYAVDPTDWHLDHVVPLEKGGPHLYSNVAVTHPHCNRKKAGKLL